ncbi:7-cyano-7-deazaguanine synthase QueC [Polynucleobacter sp. MWH-Spelu-300-X4]|nr:7-cyano-7-deazaguanine synthase QueC [Polynucleobacter sp. MWH-Spelu-300-X4]
MRARTPGAPAVILLSGGLDSATVLAIAKKLDYTPYALSFRYGQRHSSELDAAVRVAQKLGAARHEIIDLDLRRFVGGSALTDDAYAVPTSAGAKNEIPITYVPARNTIMLSVALGWAEALGGLDIFFGANAVDYSGYPDCRPEYVKSFEATANLATKAGVESTQSSTRFRIHAPIISLSKAEIIQAGIQLGVDFSMTVSCYQANAAGEACGRCESCRLRKEGFASAKVPDPTHYAS